MASSTSYNLLIITLLATVTTLVAGDQPLFHFCSPSQQSSNHSDVPTFNGNLKSLFSKLSNQAPPTGFANVAVGGYRSGGRVYGLALCRADVTSAADCRSCVTDAASEISARCPSNSSAIIWYDNCMLKYKDTDFFGKVDNDQRFYMWNTRVVSDPATFNAKTKELLTKLSKEASASSPSKLFASGEMEIDEKNKGIKLRGLVQCTRDLSGEDCEKCVNGIIGEIPSCCDGKEGGRVVGGSCNFRYEIYPFLNGTS